MTLRVIDKGDLAAFLDRLIASEPGVVGPVRKEGKHVFAPLASADEVVLAYPSTILPPKKYLFPPQETLLRFRLGSPPEAEAVLDAPPLVVVGVHPCDLRGIWATDRAFGDDHVDTNYHARRQALTIIGVDCLPDEHCFCTSVGSHLPEAGTYDLFLTDIGDAVTVEIGTERGRALLERYARTRDATGADLAGLQRSRRAKEAAIKARLNVEVQTLPLLFESLTKSPVWEELGARCLSCGNCNLVCPTCYCFDVGDLVQLNLTAGERVRRWDGCMLTDFATVAGGHNFRREAKNRVRHRYFRKFQYLMTRYGRSFCTGCGRCSRACLVHINPPDTINALLAEVEKEEA
ncbi:MAG: 4Fe-4S dicluster domain-containing protein [Anaerolineae bacterium]|nr:4Fe-4S dicluster domain-containing protein [Anaerolineae bacterium]